MRLKQTSAQRKMFTKIGLKCGLFNDIKTGPLLILPLMERALDVNWDFSLSDHWKTTSRETQMPWLSDFSVNKRPRKIHMNSGEEIWYRVRCNNKLFTFSRYLQLGFKLNHKLWLITHCNQRKWSLKVYVEVGWLLICKVIVIHGKVKFETETASTKFLTGLEWFLRQKFTNYKMKPGSWQCWDDFMYKWRTSNFENWKRNENFTNFLNIFSSILNLTLDSTVILNPWDNHGTLYTTNKYANSLHIFHIWNINRKQIPSNLKWHFPSPNPQQQ